jgi:cytochrome c553
MIPIAFRVITLLAAVAAASAAGAQPATDPVARGAQVYRDVCMRCHAADPMRDRPASAARRENGVLTAIETQGPMRWLRNLLSDADIAGVQAWLDFVVLPPGAVRPETGIWWNPAEPGRGFVLEYGQGFAAFSAFYYRDDGRPDWATTAIRYDGAVPRVEGALNQFRDGQALLAPWREPVPAPSPGTLSIRFDAPARATLDLPGGRVQIERVLLNPGSSALAPATGYPEPGIWWNPAEGGRGFVLDVQGTQLLVGAYLYDTDGTPAWLTTNGPMPTRFRFEGDWYRFVDGQTLRGAYRASRRVEPPVGRVVIDFESPRAGTLTLPDGRRIPIVRFF